MLVASGNLCELSCETVCVFYGGSLTDKIGLSYMVPALDLESAISPTKTDPFKNLILFS